MMYLYHQLYYTAVFKSIGWSSKTNIKIKMHWESFSLLLILLGLVRTHLEVLDTRVLPLEEALELKIRLSSSRKKNIEQDEEF